MSSISIVVDAMYVAETMQLAASLGLGCTQNTGGPHTVYLSLTGTPEQVEQFRKALSKSKGGLCHAA